MASPTIVTTQCCTVCGAVQTVQVPGVPGVTGADGADGVDGISAFTTTTAAFSMPAMGAAVSILVVDTSWMSLGQIVFIETAGWFEVTAITSVNQVSLTNLETAGGAYSANTAPATNINAGSKVSPGGLQGQAGATTWTAAGDIGLDPGLNPRLGITTTKGDLIANYNNGTHPRNTRLAAGVDDLLLHTESTAGVGLAWRGLDLTGVATVLLGLLPVASGGTGAANAAGARTNLGAAASGANADITSITALSTALSQAQGGTGVAALQCFSAYKSGAQTVATGSATKVQYDAENWDGATVFDATVTFRFTPTIAGKYHLSASVELSALATGTRVEIHIFKNGVVFACSPRFWNASGAAADVQAALDVDVVANGAGDYFDARVWHNHGSNRNVSADPTRTFFNGHWCG